jgi:hypothetical protein
VWILAPFALMSLAVLCGEAVKSELGYKRPTRNRKFLGFAVLAYAVLMFIYFYRTTGGASSVSIVDGRYVSMYKDRILRTIPNLWSRVMSAWMGMMAFFYLIQFPSTNKTPPSDA